MADEDPRYGQLLAVFGAEVEERVRRLNQLLLKLEGWEADKQARAETLLELVRTAHGLKAAARAADLDAIEKLAHRIESMLEDARGATERPADNWFDGVFHTIDGVTPLWVEFSERDAAPSGGLTVPMTRVEPQPPELAQAAAVPTRSAEMRGEAAASGGLLKRIASLRSDAPPAPPAPIPAGPEATEPTEPRPAARQASNGPPPSVERQAHPSERGHGASQESVRVAVGKLDALLAQAGELAVTDVRIEQRLKELVELRNDLEAWRRGWRMTRSLRANLQRIIDSPEGVESGPTRELGMLLLFAEQAEQRTQALLQRVDQVAGQLRRDTAQLALVTHSIADEVMAVRLLPVSTTFGPFERMLRDLTRSQGKEVRLAMEGGEIEIDRKILEQLRDPLMHMLRNAIDHGMETPEERVSRGKPAAGTVRLSASQRGGVIDIEVEDDGRGLDPAQLRESAVRKGLLSREQAAALDDHSAFELIYHPGFSTRTTVTETSGRGVGMDVVRQNVERLNGNVTTDSGPGRGTRFTISVPLTLATTRVILVEQGGELFAIPSAMIERNSRAQKQQLVSLEGCLAVRIDGHPVPILELAEVLDRPRPSWDSNGSVRWRPFVVLSQGERRVALLADKLVGEQEIVVKALGWPLRRVRNVGGAAVLGSGQTVVILNPSDLLKAALRLVGAGARLYAVEVAVGQVEQPKKRVLVVDDSITTRTLVRSILAAAGYETAVATDGDEALDMLRAGPIDLVVSDVEMARMDGFALTAEIRRDQSLSRIPVVLVTSLDTSEHRERGAAAGADAYIVKGAFDQGKLLETVNTLL